VGASPCAELLNAGQRIDLCSILTRDPEAVPKLLFVRSLPTRRSNGEYAPSVNAGNAKAVAAARGVSSRYRSSAARATCSPARNSFSRAS
jgi:hypothetical protein